LKGTYGVQFFENVMWGKLWIRFSIIFSSQVQLLPLRAENLPTMHGTKGGHSQNKLLSKVELRGVYFGNAPH
jgi:hypothetical protein